MKTKIEQIKLAAQIAEWLDAHGIYHECLPRGDTAAGESETPERFAVARGQIIFITAAPNGEKIGAARRLEKQMERRKSGAIIVRADDFTEFINQFSAIRAALEEKARTLNLYD